MISIGFKVQVSDLMLDKISLTLDISQHDEDVLAARLSALYAESLPAFTHKGGYCYGLRHSLGQPSHGHILLQWCPLESSPGAAHKRYLRAEWNPHRAPSERIHQLFDNLLPGEVAQLLENAQCTRLDFAIDIVGVPPEALILSHPKIRKSKAYFYGNKIQSYYLGAECSDKQIVLYDKVAEMKRRKAHGQHWIKIPVGCISRIEVRRRHSFPLAQLHQLQNPFTPLGVTTLSTLPNDSGLFALFRSVCADRGPQHALTLLSHTDRKQMQSWLNKNVCSWWHPEALWSQAGPLFDTILNASSAPPSNSIDLALQPTSAEPCN